MTKSKTTNKRGPRPQKSNPSTGGQPPTGLLKPLALDIALGRGGMANNNPGNKMSRKIIASYHVRFFQAQQASASRRDKAMIVNTVLDHLAKEGFRFVEKVNDVWVEASFKKGRAKVIQTLREGAYELRKESVVCNEVTSSNAGSTPVLTQETGEWESIPADGISVISAESLEHLHTVEVSDFVDVPFNEGLELLGPLGFTDDDWPDIEPLPLSFSSNNESSSGLEPLPLVPSLSIFSLLASGDTSVGDTCLGILSGLLDLEL